MPPMGDHASDIRVEFDRLNGSSGHHFRFVYHNGSTFRPTDYRTMAVWADVVAAATQGLTAFTTYMSTAYPPWWADLPGTDEELSACNAVREIRGLSTLT